MSLQIWLPLNGNLKNNGLSSMTTSGTPTYGVGKIGQALDLINSQQIDIVCSGIANVSSFSICFWIKGTKDTSDADWSSPILLRSNKTGGSEDYSFRFGKDNRASSNGYPICMYCNSGYNIVTSNSLSFSTNEHWDKWIHVCFTTDGTNVKAYRDGVLVSSASNGTNGWLTGNIRLRAERYNGFLNDFRIYDNVLTPEEIKKISRGLVAHYPLSDMYNASNLIYNGFGEYGSSGWDGTTASTSDLPSDSAVKASFVGGSTSGLIPVNVNNTFTVSCYVKTSGETSGTAYPSILPYDADKKFISNYNCPDGFNTSWSTTLAQPLKKGDTVIYATDLSAWSTATNNYYYRVAVFGYEDGQGNVYPDFTYTQDSLSFGSYSDKSKLNKTNNTITLNSAYAGKDRPAGTKICQATAGSTYFYPFGGISLSSITNWTAKTATFSFYSQNRLRYAKYIKWYSDAGSYSVKFAGVKISDNTWETSTLYDVSGFGYNLSKFGNANVSYTSNTPRYRIATSVGTASNSGYSLSVATQGGTSVATLSAWVYETARSGGDRDLVINNGRYITIKSTGVLSTYAYGKSPAGYHDGTTVIPLNTWTHLAVVWDDNYVYGYINGVQDFKIACTGNFTSMANTYLLGEPNNTRTFHGYVSDVRFYSTAFSADDILALYQKRI